MQPRDLTSAERTMKGHLEALTDMLRDMTAAPAGTYTPEAIQRIEARKQEAKDALKSEAARQAVIQENRRRGKK